MSDPAVVPMSLRDHLRVLQRRRWLLLAVLALCVGGAAAYAFLAPPSYEARAQVIVASHESRSTLLSAATPVLSMLGEPVSALGGSDLARTHLEWQPSTVPGFEGIGFKGGSLPGVLTDATADIARARGARVVQVAVRQIAAARNAGAATARGDRLLFVDADTLANEPVLRALMAMDRADVCLILIDAVDGVTEQDTKVAGYAHNAGKACVFAVNKWDLVEKETGTLENMRKILLDRFSFMDYAPVVFLSAKTGQRVEKLFEVIRDVHEQAGKRLKTGLLNELIAEATAMVPTPQDKGKHLKIYYATQVATHPPQFLLFVNNTELMHFSYERYLENQLRKNFGFQGTPIRIYLRNKEKDAQEGIHHNAKN